MYVTVRRYKIDPGTADEIIRQVKENFVPILSRSIGFVSYQLFLEEDGSICSVSTFRTRAGMEEANESALEWANANLLHLMPFQPEVAQGPAEIYIKK